MIGSVTNFPRVYAELPFFKGMVSVDDKPGGDIDISYFGGPAPIRRRTTFGGSATLGSGTLDGAPVEVVSLDRSTIDDQMMVAVVRRV